MSRLTFSARSWLVAGLAVAFLLMAMGAYGCGSDGGGGGGDKERSDRGGGKNTYRYNEKYGTAGVVGAEPPGDKTRTTTSTTP